MFFYIWFVFVCCQTNIATKLHSIELTDTLENIFAAEYDCDKYIGAKDDVYPNRCWSALDSFIDNSLEFML